MAGKANSGMLRQRQENTVWRTTARIRYDSRGRHEEALRYYREQNPGSSTEKRPTAQRCALREQRYARQQRRSEAAQRTSAAAIWR
jgi:hypothetical protein